MKLHFLFQWTSPTLVVWVVYCLSGGQALAAPPINQKPSVRGEVVASDRRFELLASDGKPWIQLVLGLQIGQLEFLFVDRGKPYGSLGFTISRRYQLAFRQPKKWQLWQGTNGAAALQGDGQVRVIGSQEKANRAANWPILIDGSLRGTFEFGSANDLRLYDERGLLRVNIQFEDGPPLQIPGQLSRLNESLTLANGHGSRLPYRLQIWDQGAPVGKTEDTLLP